MGRLALVMASPGTIERPKLDESQLGQGEWIVTVYNNEHNTYDEVMVVLMEATGCSAEEAYIETWEIDHLGKSVVHHSDEGECNRVAGVIRTIGIQVEVTQE